MRPLRRRLEEARARLGVPWEILERDYRRGYHFARQHFTAALSAERLGRIYDSVRLGRPKDRAGMAEYVWYEAEASDTARKVAHDEHRPALGYHR